VRLFVALLILSLSFPGHAAREHTGITPSGAVYRVAVPDGWQAGDGLVLYQNDLSFERGLAPDLGPLLAVQLAQGYAVAASGYRQPGWNGFSAVADNQELLARLAIELGQPGQIIAYGRAMGGHAALQLALAPDLPVTAALPLCPITRADDFWQAALDLRLVYDHTCNHVEGAALPAATDLPWLLPAHQISASGLEQIVLRSNRCLGLNLPAWQRSAGQQARLEQVHAASGISDNEQLMLGLVHASLGLGDLVRSADKLAGRAAFGNGNAEYGVDLDNGIRRVPADAFAALEFRLRSGLTPVATPLPGDPAPARILSLHGDSDQLLPASHGRWLHQQLPSEHLQQAWIDQGAPGHCDLSAAETRATWDGLRAWLGQQITPAAERLQRDCLALAASGEADGGCRLSATAPADKTPTLPAPRPDPVAVDSRFSGSWYGPERAGEGWLLQVLDRHTALLHAFTVPAAGEPGDQLWLTALGRIDGDGIAFDQIERVHGRGFGSGYQPDDVWVEHWGSARIVFSACGRGELRFQGPAGYGSGSRQLHQLMHLGSHDCADSNPVATPAQTAATGIGAVSGSFYDPAAPGQGLVIAAQDDGRLMLVLFGHAASGDSPVWLQAQGRLDDDGRLHLGPAVRPHGSRFEAFDPGQLDLSPWGDLELAFDGCDLVQLRYRAPSAEFGDGELTLERLTWPMATGTCPLPTR